MNELDIFNGEDQDITVVTDYGHFAIPAHSSHKVLIGEGVQFHQPELFVDDSDKDKFYVQEEGSWYIETSNCVGHDAEIYNCDTFRSGAI